MADPGEKIGSFKVLSVDGKERELSDYLGKTLLVVNIASRCGFVPQLGSFQTLYQQYRSRGLEILAFPSNDFLMGEPGTNHEIESFCQTKYKTTFPLFSKIVVRGNDIHPLYRCLINSHGFQGEVTWNFNKFLIDPDGNVRARFGARTDPMDPAITQMIDTILPALPA